MVLSTREFERMSVEEALRVLGSSAEGLSEEEAGEPSPKEAEELARARAWRSAEGSWCTRASWSRGGARRAVSAGSKASAHCEGWGREPGKSGKI